MTTAQRIDQLIRANWSTQLEAAKALRISPQYMCDLVRGRRALSMPTAVALSRVLRREKLGLELLIAQLTEHYNEELQSHA